MRAALLVAVALLAPLALAGSERDPDVPGTLDFPDPTLDFVGAWMESASDGIVITIKIAGAARPPADHFYALSARYDGVRRVAVIGFDQNGTMHTDLRPPNFNRPLVRGAEGFSETLRDARFRPGTPAYVSAVLPFSALPDLGPGKVLVDLYAGTGTYTRGGGWDDVDGNETVNAYVVQKAALPAAARGLRTPLVVGAIVLVGALGGVVGVAIARRRGRAPPPTEPSRPDAPGPAAWQLDPKR